MKIIEPRLKRSKTKTVKSLVSLRDLRLITSIKILVVAMINSFIIIYLLQFIKLMGYTKHPITPPDILTVAGEQQLGRFIDTLQGLFGHAVVEFLTESPLKQ